MVIILAWYICFFNDTATTEIYTLSLHDALPISPRVAHAPRPLVRLDRCAEGNTQGDRAALDHHPTSAPCRRCCPWAHRRSEEHTSELQSRQYLVCRLLLEKKKKNLKPHTPLADQ